MGIESSLRVHGESQNIKSMILPEAHEVYLRLQACEVEEVDGAFADEELAARLLA